jgi:hypothetical protein
MQGPLEVDASLTLTLELRLWYRQLDRHKDS